MCQVAWKFGKTTRDWQTGVIIRAFKKEIASNVQNTGDITPKFAEKSISQMLRKNVEK